MRSPLKRTAIVSVSGTSKALAEGPGSYELLEDMAGLPVRFDKGCSFRRTLGETTQDGKLFEGHQLWYCGRSQPGLTCGNISKYAAPRTDTCALTNSNADVNANLDADDHVVAHFASRLHASDTRRVQSRQSLRRRFDNDYRFVCRRR